MNKKVKALLLVLCAIVFFAAGIFATLAYLQDQEEVENTLTVGDVTIKLDESIVNEYGVAQGGRTEEGEDYLLVPGRRYTKDPVVTVDANSENAWVFVKVVNPIANVESEDTIETQILANNWVKVGTFDGNATLYRYNVVVTKASEDQPLPVFADFGIASDKERGDLEQYNTAPNNKITITAFAVQEYDLDVDEATDLAKQELGLVANP